MLDEGLLKRVQRAVLRDPFDRHDLGAVVRNRQGEAGVRAAPVDEHCARAALAVVAALLRTRQAELLPEQVEERRARVELERVLVAVDVERHRVVLGHAGTLPTGPPN